ncbi:MAG TPA: hypothetical protein VJ805_14200 [Nitrospiraceae bacterium]|nr:hypothetical protein [Nitrospiraceae bacterium]
MAFESWMLTATANGIVAIIYGVISYLMIREASGGHQWKTNPLLTATIAIFVTCTVGHGLHGVMGLWAEGTHHVKAVGDAARIALTDWRLLIWDSLTAVVALWYWHLRGRFAILFHGAALCEDMAKRQAEAMLIHDDVVQGLTRAKLALDLGRKEEGHRAIAETLEAAKGIISGLLGEPGKDTVVLGMGDLTRAPRR